MYAKNDNKVTFFTDPNGKNTDKVIYGRVSEGVKTSKTDENGKAVYEYESWNCRFVGKALDKAKTLADKTHITLTEWAARCPYDKEAKRSFPYLMVMDFTVDEEK